MRLNLVVLCIIILFVCTGCSDDGKDETLPDKLRTAGLAVDQLRILPPGDLPGGASQGWVFLITEHCENCGGKILEFGQNTVEMNQIITLWRAMGQYVYTKDGTLLQINGQIPEAVAERYREVLLK
jgi:hypothetical protein